MSNSTKILFILIAFIGAEFVPTQTASANETVEVAEDHPLERRKGRKKRRRKSKKKAKSATKTKSKRPSRRLGKKKRKTSDFDIKISEKKRIKKINKKRRRPRVDSDGNQIVITKPGKYKKPHKKRKKRKLKKKKSIAMAGFGALVGLLVNRSSQAPRPRRVVRVNNTPSLDLCTYTETKLSYECSIDTEGYSINETSASSIDKALERTLNKCKADLAHRDEDYEETIDFEFTDDSGKVYPYCLFEDSDNDGDGWGWENKASCVMSEDRPNEIWTDKASGEEMSFCFNSNSDEDGDMFGEENGVTCRMPTRADMQTTIILPSMDVATWCEESIECDSELGKRRKTGIFDGGVCSPL